MKFLLHRLSAEFIYSGHWFSCKRTPSKLSTGYWAGNGTYSNKPLSEILPTLGYLKLCLALDHAASHPAGGRKKLHGSGILVYCINPKSEVYSTTTYLWTNAAFLEFYLRVRDSFQLTRSRRLLPFCSRSTRITIVFQPPRNSIIIVISILAVHIGKPIRILFRKG